MKIHSVTPRRGSDTANPELNANVVVSIFAVERVFARISVDGEVVFEGRLAPGETKVFEANDQVMVLTGNAAALRITYNGRDLGLMGNIGEVVSRVYLITGVAIPTPTISPTPTNTLPADDHPTPTLTPSLPQLSRLQMAGSEADCEITKYFALLLLTSSQNSFRNITCQKILFI